jgi:hypothetical protein
MGMPAWAGVLAAPYALDKFVVDPISNIYGIYKGIRDDQADQRDKAQLLEDMTKFSQDPNAAVDYKKYSNPEAAARATNVFQGLQKQTAAPVLDKFTGDVNAMAGPGGERFYGDPASREEMIKQGLVVPQSQNNPYINQGVQDYQRAAESQETMANVLSGTDPRNIGTQLSSIAMQEKLPGQLHSVTGVMENLAKGRVTENKEKLAKGDLEASQNLDYVYRNKTPLDQFKALGELSSVTGASPEWTGKQADDLRATNRGDQQMEMFDKRLAQSERQHRESIAAADARSEKRETAKTRGSFQKDRDTLTRLTILHAKGGGGAIVLNGMPTMFTSDGDGQEMLKQTLLDKYQEMQIKYPNEMENVKPPVIKNPNPSKATAGVAGTHWKAIPGK